jgi:glucose/arabinose dehydrogenase
VEHPPSVARLASALFLIGTTVAAQVHAQNLPDGFALESVVGEPFDGSPVGFAFLPDGRILIVEKETGNVRVSAVGSGTSVVVATLSGVASELERGLLGIAIDPSWPQRPYVYLMATYADGKTRVTMHAASGDLSEPTSTDLRLDSPYVLLDYILNIYPNHKGGTLRFGRDGLLFVSTGDDGGVCEAMDVNAYNGKILRLDVAAMPGGGGGPPPMTAIAPLSNPFFGSSDSARLVFAMGLRNPFRFTIDPLYGDVYIADVGAHDWEEVDEITLAGYSGSNFGWPFYEAGLFIPRSCTDQPPHVDPIYAYPHLPAEPAAVVAGPLYRRVSGSPVTFPFEYQGNFFLHDHYAGWIRRLVKAGRSWALAPAVPGQDDPENWATDMAHISDLQTGPDGALYLMVLVGEPGVDRGLHRIVNTLPTDSPLEAPRIAAVAVPNPGQVSRGVRIRFRRANQEASRLLIYDSAGRLVRALATSSAHSALFWDGRTASGMPVSPGLYVYELQDRAGIGARGKMLLVR